MTDLYEKWKNATNAADSEAVEAQVSELLYETRDYTWQIQARRVLALLKEPK